MGTSPSKPQPGAHLRVIAAGLPRTGTASITAALEILLRGPVYHAGIQHILSYPSEIPMKNAMNLLANHKNPTATKAILSSMFSSGWTAVIDSPFAQFTPELLQIYPDAVVICTVRDPEKWMKSLGELVQAGQIATGWHTALVPIARLFPKYTALLGSTRWKELYSGYEGVEIYHRHIEWLKSVVPEDKLFFIDVKDGWEPLCKALKVPVPENVPFPRVNDGDEVKRIARRFVVRGVVRWVVVTGVAVAILAIPWQVWRRR